MSYDFLPEIRESKSAVTRRVENTSRNSHNNQDIRQLLNPAQSYRRYSNYQSIPNIPIIINDEKSEKSEKSLTTNHRILSARKPLAEPRLTNQNENSNAKNLLGLPVAKPNERNRRQSVTRYNFSVSNHKVSLSKIKPEFRIRANSIYSSSPNRFDRRPSIFFNKPNKIDPKNDLNKEPMQNGRRESIVSIDSLSSIGPDIVYKNKLSSVLSKTGQCAILKCYEDEIFKEIKWRIPDRYFTRITTPLFDLNSGDSQYSDIWELGSVRSESVFSEISEPNKHNTEEKLRNYLVDKHISAAMEILDDLKKITPRNECSEESDDSQNCALSDSGSVITELRTNESDVDQLINQICRKYSKWIGEWSRMLKIFF